MEKLPRIEAEISFIPESEGGRETIPELSGCLYRPHLVVGTPNQRKAITIGDEIQETYVGVAFQSGQENVEFNKPFLAELVLVFYPHPIYEPLVPGATFTIREGPHIVGFGKVKGLLIDENPN